MTDYYIEIPHDDYVIHHGVIGMKWGIRRYQNKDGSYTAQGRARYLKDVSARGVNVKKAAAKWDAEVAKQSRPKKKSDHRLKLEAKYRASGMTQKQAEVAAEKRIQKEKKIAIGAGVAAAAVGAGVAAKKYYDYSTDKVVGTKDNPLYRMQMFNGKDNKEGSVFATAKKVDNEAYAGIWAKQQKFNIRAHNRLDNVKNGGRDQWDAYNMELVFNKGAGMKVASDKNAKKAFEQLRKNDPAFEAALQETINGDNAKRNAILRGIGKHNVYDRFVVNLGDNGRNTEAAKRYFKEMRDKGYGAIKDRNDNKYSHFAEAGHSAVITLGENYDWDAKKLSDTEINSNAKKATARITAKMATKAVAKAAPIIGGYAALESARPINRAASLYRSGVSKDQIAEQLGVSLSTVQKWTNGIEAPKSKQNKRK